MARPGSLPRRIPSLRSLGVPAVVLLTAGVLGAGLACGPGDEPPPDDPGPLECRVAVRDLVTRLEANYIGHALMRDAHRIAAYEARREAVLAASDTTPPPGCTALANRLTQFFEDGHLSVFERPGYPPAELDSIRRARVDARLSPDSLGVLERLARVRQTEDPRGLEGLWSDGRSRFVLTRQDDRFVAHILRTSVAGVGAGERKMTLQAGEDGYVAEYLPYEGGPRHEWVGVHRNGDLLRGGGVTWVRDRGPGSTGEGWPPPDPEDALAPSVVRLDADHTLLTIPSFSVDADAFAELLAAHGDDLTRVRVLVIDIRGNRGGNTIYFPLIERFATGDLPPSQGRVLSSPDNVEYFRRRMGRFGWFSSIYRPLVRRMDANPGAIVDGPAYPGRDFDPPPARLEAVAILADGGSMSAAESFILHARAASDRVMTFGQPTDGVIDYTSVNAVPLNSGRRHMFLRYPTGTLHADIPLRGYNRTGILPDVPLPDTLSDPVGAVRAHIRQGRGS